MVQQRSGKHDNHCGNVQVITAPDGWPLWTSPVRPGREHDTTALREHGEILPCSPYGPTTTCGSSALSATKAGTPRSPSPTKADNAACTTCSSSSTVPTTPSAMGERGNSLLKTTFKALRNGSVCPWSIDRITAAAWSSCTSNTASPLIEHPLLNVNGRYSESLTSQYDPVLGGLGTCTRGT